MRWLLECRSAGTAQCVPGRLTWNFGWGQDPSCTAYMQALVFNKGYHALQAYRVMHSLWERGQRTMAYTLQSRVSQVPLQSPSP